MSRCPCGRSCKDCVYESLCGGCLDENCIHIRVEQQKTRSQGCLFCHKKGIDAAHSCATLLPPKEIDCISPWVLEETLDSWIDVRENFADQPTQPKWSPLIPEVSEISETTSCFNVRDNEGKWRFHEWNPVAWDMTGYLLDKVQGPSWFPQKEQEPNTWHSIIGNEYNWIEDLVMVDRLPDYLSLQTPPSATIAGYLDRLYACQWNLIADSDAPSLWLLTHGYPSYIDWPPAWHWNLGIRMLSSLIEYIGAAMSDMLHSPGGVWDPTKAKRTSGPVRAPFVNLGEESRLVFPPSTEMDWVSFPGIIPFIPGADTNQLSWFANQIAGWGYDVLALDALNTISHENFKGLSEAVNVLKKSGARQVIVYGPWPLHIPTKYMPHTNVSFIPSAHHMDMTDSPPRFWRKKEQREDSSWQKKPNYRTSPLSEVNSRKGIDVCTCPACQAAVEFESDPRSVWRWGHLLNAGWNWQKKHATTKDEDKTQLHDSIRLWYQGPSTTAYRKCLHHISTRPHFCERNLHGTIHIGETSVDIRYPDGLIVPSEYLRWTERKVALDWRAGYPQLEEA